MKCKTKLYLVTHHCTPVHRRHRPSVHIKFGPPFSKIRAIVRISMSLKSPGQHKVANQSMDDIARLLGDLEVVVQPLDISVDDTIDTIDNIYTIDNLVEGSDKSSVSISVEETYETIPTDGDKLLSKVFHVDSADGGGDNEGRRGVSQDGGGDDDVRVGVSDSGEVDCGGVDCGGGGDVGGGDSGVRGDSGGGGDSRGGDDSGGDVVKSRFAKRRNGRFARNIYEDQLEALREKRRKAGAAEGVENRQLLAKSKSCCNRFSDSLRDLLATIMPLRSIGKTLFAFVFYRVECSIVHTFTTEIVSVRCFTMYMIPRRLHLLPARIVLQELCLSASS